MTVWLVQTIATCAIAVLLSLLFVRWLEQPRMQAPDDIGSCLDQLAKTEADLRLGLIDDATADAARLEIRKRALEGRAEQRPTKQFFAGRSQLGWAFAAGIAIAGAIGFFATTRDGDAVMKLERTVGADARASVARDAPAVRRLATETQAAGSANWWQPPPPPQSGLPSVEEMIERLAARLEKNPKDGEGWRTLGWSYLNVGKYSEASDAYARAIELNPGNMELKTARIEATIRSSDGRVTTAAAKAIEDALKIDPQDLRVRFFGGLAKAQSGDKAAALADWGELLGKVKADEPWLPELKNSISELERELGVSAPVQAVKSKSTTSGDVPVASKNESQLLPPIEKGPNAQDMQAAKAMSPADRSAMIHDMVDGLARRLEQSPRDAEGWIKLIRSRVVLGETEQARQALTRGMDVFADDATQRDRIVAAARELGLSE
jgi:cytochrome c-type biogenesis protein CcmH